MSVVPGTTFQSLVLTFTLRRLSELDMDVTQIDSRALLQEVSLSF